MRVRCDRASCAGGVCDRAAKTSGSDDYLLGCDFLAAGNHTDARFAFVEQGIHRAVGANFGAVLLCSREHGFDEQARINRCFFGQPGDRAGLRAKRRLVLASFVWRHRCGG